MVETHQGLRGTVMVFLVAAVFGAAASRWLVHAEQARQNPNVVVLRSEKRISLTRERIPLSEMAKACGDQTGRTFTLDDAFTKSEKRYSFILTNAPLASALAATARMTDATWEKRGSGYHLRPMTPEERIADPERLEELLDDVESSLKGVSEDDATLSAAQAAPLRDFRQGDHTGPGTLPTFVAGDASRWRVMASPNRIVIISPPTGDLGRPVIAGTGWTRGAVGTVGGGGQ